MNNRGFTLIELVVAIGIVIGLVVVGVTSMSQFYSRDKVVSARNEVVSTIKMAKNYAVTAQSPAGYTLQLDAVEVVLGGSKQLSVFPMSTVITSGVRELVSDLEKSYFTTVMKDTEIKLSFGGDINMIFSVPEGKLLNEYGTPESSGKTISISADGVGETLVVNISAAGVISE